MDDGTMALVNTYNCMQGNMIDSRGEQRLVRALEHNTSITQLNVVCCKGLTMWGTLVLIVYRELRLKMAF